MASPLSFSARTAAMAHVPIAQPLVNMSEGLDEVDFITQTVTSEIAYPTRNGPGHQRLQVQHLTPVYPIDPTMQGSPSVAVAPIWGPRVREAFDSAGNTLATLRTIQPSTDAPSGDSILRQDWEHHQGALRAALNSITRGFLEAAAQNLLRTTTWLVNRVPDLRLDEDPRNPATAAAVFTARLGVWKALNCAWLALCSKQQDLMRSEPQVRGGLMSQATISHMGDELVRLCDILHKDGLVDYEYGIWEEEIVEELIECLDQYDYC